MKCFIHPAVRPVLLSPPGTATLWFTIHLLSWLHVIIKDSVHLFYPIKNNIGNNYHAKHNPPSVLIYYKLQAGIRVRKRMTFSRWLFQSPQPLICINSLKKKADVRHFCTPKSTHAWTVTAHGSDAFKSVPAIRRWCVVQLPWFIAPRYVGAKICRTAVLNIIKDVEMKQNSCSKTAPTNGM